ncbi:MAG: PASTA domain-containing protein [Clostridia bacterium]|nr:PASTA domain-containing protein [Clostridia bacterium]MBR3553759.1 PASTA domain-containing protein [Clostridia bacterium]
MSKKWNPFPKNRARHRNHLMFKLRARSMTFFVFALLFAVSFLRVGWIIFVHGDDYRSEAEQSQLYDTEIRAVRGTIYDINRTPLVTSASAWILCVNPNEILKFFNNVNIPGAYEAYCEDIGGRIAKAVGMKKKKVVAMMEDSEHTYVRVKKKVDATERLALDEILTAPYAYAKTSRGADRNVYATSFFTYESDTLRLYPENNFASTVIGVTDNDGSGISGVEKYYNTDLSGKAGRIVTAKNARGQTLDSSYETVFDTTQGSGIILTIDQNIQRYLENALVNALESTGAKGTFGIVMDVDTGAILAMSDKPDFDLNNPRVLQDAAAAEALKAYEGTDEYAQMMTDALYAQWNSYCVTSTYEPGSTFKIFTAAAALEEGIVNLDTTYTCNGAYQVAGTVIHCANRSGHGYQTLTQGLMNSCNPFFISMGQKMGVETFYKYFEAFGFTERTGIDLTGEAYPVVHQQENMSVVDLASTSFGQSVRLSPIQMITAGCAIANGGKLMVPYIVDSVVDENGNILSKNEPTVKRQVISEGTAATVRQMMEAVVEGGTGKNAYIEGYRVAGKTATSEKLDVKKTDENQLLYVASFLCFAPADDPQVAVLVGVDEPPGEYRGGGVLAAPIAKEVLEPTLKYLNVEPRYTQEELKAISKTTPGMIGKSVSQARALAEENNLTIKIIGEGETVLSQVPSAGSTIAKNGVVVVYTNSGEAMQTVNVPNFAGMTAASVNETAAAYGLNVILSGPSDAAGATVYQQSIAPETQVDAGSTVTVDFRITENMDD